MTIPLWCLLVAILLPLPWSVTAMGERKKQFGTADNRNPRQQTAQLEGKGARAYAAHLNALEALPPFGFAVLVAHVTHADPMLSTILAVVWVVARVLHGVFYIADIDKARSAAFSIGLLTVVGQFVIAAMAAGVPPHH